MGERANKFISLVNASEMYCSLKYEDFRGCPYNAFTAPSIAALSLSSTLICTISLIVGM